MRTFSRLIALAASGAIGLAGCSNPFGGSSGLSVGKSGTYDQFSKDYQERSVVAPGMGLDNKPEPSALQKFGSAVAAVPEKVGSSLKSGATKATSWMAPSSKTEVAAAAPTTSSGWFPKKQEASTELHVATARVYEKNGNYAAAAEEYEKALKQSPNDVTALLSYGHLQDHLGKLSDATNLYLRAVKANPREAAAHNDLGLCYARRGMINDSLKSLSKAVELQPERALYRNNLATVLVDQRRTEEALAQLRTVQSEAVANYNIGYLLLQRKQDTLAESHFRRAMQLDPSMAEASDWCERLAMRSSSQPTTVAYQRPGAPAVQLAAMPTPRPGSFGPAPEPAAPVYTRPQMSPAADPSLVGNRYATAPDAATASAGVVGSPPGNNLSPPTPDTLSNYHPAIQNAELRFLPPVQ